MSVEFVGYYPAADSYLNRCTQTGIYQGSQHLPRIVVATIASAHTGSRFLRHGEWYIRLHLVLFS
ncbi:hypothetical protein SAMN06265337_0294 [Hymenobacter gelipurpurascens]|uniref:Uncharacterized protein n=1 Tax=Hymenobacter gelipurpurascens TaxID=89968 RepID=A0A212T3M3_9BACT|nr:hypothetical protein SAMN06265337_0294 [Hymenobacter gelipurpurascens]